jgi:hypothetical protein
VHVLRREGGEGQFERAATLPMGGAAPQFFEPALRFASMPAEEDEATRDARREAKQQPPRGRRGRRPRRTAEERAAVQTRSPEQIEEIRAARAAKRRAAESSESPRR